VDVWVLSCRAFSRRIEFGCLRAVFEDLDVQAVTLPFRDTGRNAPLREFLEYLAGQPPSGDVTLSRDAFNARCPRLYFNSAANR
jgi:predicted enzyme involved in methoxymalonyl-ACP biosynthesis